jgi:uncharacterized protein YdhG (YjbR/CyaY superfamily)
MKAKPQNVDMYISEFPRETQILLETLRTTIRKAAPKADEVISYGMPAYKFKGMLCYFAGYKNHIGLYPMASGISHFKKELKDYQTSKGTVQFPLDKKIPTVLITKIIKFRLKENEGKEKLKKLKKKK